MATVRPVQSAGKHGSAEISAKEKCTGDLRLHGTFTGHYEDFLFDIPSWTGHLVEQ